MLTHTDTHAQPVSLPVCQVSSRALPACLARRHVSFSVFLLLSLLFYPRSPARRGREQTGVNFSVTIHTMAAVFTVFILFLHIVTASVLDSASAQDFYPRLTGCVSANMESFHCRWNAGSSQKKDLRLFYINKKSPHTAPKEWSECPHYSTDRPNECFFNENHTTIWTFYRVQLRSKDQSILYDENIFDVQDIVQPDPPVDLNWTLLNESVSSHYYDIMLSWKPPESADVEMGWMRLQYEVQYQNTEADKWQVLDLVKTTHRSIYGLKTNVYYKVRVRCKMLGGKEFGEFSDLVYVHIPSTASQFPLVALLIFGALCFVAILMLIIILQQEKLMVLLLPPVPEPKIRGIDPELLKKGKLSELTSIFGSPLDLRPELYNNDPWVEFIDLDMEEPFEKLTDLDADFLKHNSLSSHSSLPTTYFRDNDSGRASCSDPDLPCDPEATPFHTPIPNQILNDQKPYSTACEDTSLPIQSLAAGEPSVSLCREALYTQVSDVRSSGKVLLSPKEQPEAEKTNSKETDKDIVDMEEENRNLQLLVVNPDCRGDMSEMSAGKLTPTLPTGDLSEPCRRSCLSTSPYQESGTTSYSPTPVYTVVEGVDRQNSLLLTPNLTPSPHLIPKTVPTLDGYLTPDLLGSIAP